MISNITLENMVSWILLPNTRDEFIAFLQPSNNKSCTINTQCIHPLLRHRRKDIKQYIALSLFVFYPSIIYNIIILVLQ